MTTTLLREPPTEAPPAAPPVPHRSPVTRFVRGRPDDPTWVRPALLGLLAVTAFLYLWDLGASGWANSYYSAAVQAASHSWKAFFFGSSDAANSITVDKAPAFLWPMALSARIFGVNSWSILVPQALEGVAAVGILYAAVRRWFTPAAALLAGAVLALTPVAALMFRFNNPDALLVLLLTAAGYATMRAIEDGSTKWVVIVGTLVGFGFLAKMLQALLVVPAFGLAYLVAAPGPVLRRLRQLLIAGVALVVSAGWWVATVALWPAGSRPYIGGSQNNSILNLIFGYNGFGRLTGSEAGSVGGGGAGATNGVGRWGATGLSRLFNSDFGGQISWLLPGALLLLAAVLVLTWRTPRTARTRAAMLVWGGWLVLTGLAISLGKGIIHSYYTVALAPAIGAVVGIGAVSLWHRRSHPAARYVLAAATAVTVWWSHRLLERVPAWHPMLRDAILIGGLAAAIGIAVWPHLHGRALHALAAVALVTTLAGPAAWTWATVTTPHSGALPSSGPTAAGGLGGPGGAPGGGNFRPANGTGNAPTGGAGGIGGILNSSTASTELVQVLQKDSGQYTWAAATVSANQAAGYQLASDEPVMAIGGFNGTDPSPTLAQFQQWVREGKIHYFIAGGMGGPGGSSGTGSAISSWVTSNFTATTVGNVTLYDLTSAS